MSNVTFTSGLQSLERMSDYLNPILVKETRQALKSRQFIITFILMLVASWLISVFGVLLAGESLEFGSAGRLFFIFYYDVLALAIFVVVPYTAYRGLVNERDHTTLELLSITSLSPRQLVWGKLWSAMVQVFIYYSAIAPFIAFTSMLQGFDMMLVAWSLTISVAITLTMTMLALTLAAVPQSKQTQGGATLIMFGGLLWVIGLILFGAGALLMETIPFDDRDFWIGTGCFLVGLLSSFYVFTQIATAHLTFESDNRSTGIRLACSAQFLLFWVALFITKWLVKSGIAHAGDFAVFCVFATLHSAAVGFFTSSEADFASRRVRRNYPRSQLLRFFSIPFLPGGQRGFLYLLLHLALIIILATVVFGFIPFWSDWAGMWTAFMCCYVVAYVGIGAAMGRLLRRASPDVKPMHTRVITLILFAMGVIVPYLPAMFHPQKLQWASDLLRVTNPFETLDRMWSGWRGTLGHEPFVILTAAGIGLLLNVHPMISGVREVMREPRTPLAPAAQPESVRTDQMPLLEPAE